MTAGYEILDPKPAGTCQRWVYEHLHDHTGHRCGLPEDDDRHDPGGGRSYGPRHPYDPVVAT